MLIFEGEYANGKRHGKGKEYIKPNIISFEGEYFEDKKWNGKIKEYDRRGKLVYEGEYINGNKKP